MPLPTVTLEGRHVRLEPLEPRHVDELWEPASSPDIWRYMPIFVQTKADLARVIEGAMTMYREGTALPFLQRDVKTGKAAGSTRIFDADLANRRMEIGHTWLGRAFQHTGINTEAKLLLMTHAFEAMKAIRVQLKTDERNVQSQSAIARIGAVREGVLRNHWIMPDGFYRNSVMYSITDKEWPTVRQRLAGLLARPRPARPKPA